MRGESVANANYKARTESEAFEDTEIGGYNVIKVAKYLNLVVGTALIAFVVTEFITFKFINPFDFSMTVFQG